jgi:GNAT superfamily N-acetyltransferase
MTTRNLDALFDPQAWLTYASTQPPILMGDIADANRPDASRRPTVAVLRGPCEQWGTALAHLGDAGVRAVVLDAAAGAVDPGSPVAACLHASSRPYLMRMLGPGDCGIVDARHRFALGPAFANHAVDEELPPEGSCAWVAQSGDAARAALAFARTRGLGLSHMVALGDAIDVDAADAIDYLAGDARTKAVLLVLNRVRSARKFMSAIRACVRNKPVLVWCEPAAGEDALAYDAALERAGVVRLPGLPALLDAWAVLQSPEVGGSDVLARYRAARERLARTPPALPPHRLDYEDAQAWLRNLQTAQGPVQLTQRQVRCLLEDFDVAVRIGGDTDVDTDLRLAMRDDPAFGPYLTLHPAHDPTLAQGARNGATIGRALLPLDAVLAEDVLDQIAPLAVQCRGSAIALLVHLSELLCSVRQVLEFDACLCREGAHAYLRRAKIRVGGPGIRGPLAIRPYPLELETHLVWDDIALTIRPIRPEDEAAHAAFFRAMSAEDLRLRFFGVIRQPDHSQLARYVQIDYDREMAFVACSTQDGGDTTPFIHGVVRAVADPDNERAEFAVTIRSGEQGHHLGRLLMDRIIAYCKRRGTHVMVGEILRENTPMLALARDCGFSLARSEDPAVVSVRLPLNPPATQTETA